MSDFRKLLALALALSLVAMVSPALAQGGTTPLDPTSSSLTETEDPPPPDDGDKDFDEWDSDVLNQTSPSFDAPSPEPTPFEPTPFEPPPSAEPSAASGSPVGWLGWLQSWFATGTR